MGLKSFFLWFSGGSHQYMQLYHCMNHDTFWVAVTVILDLSVAVGYVLIARHWWKNERTLPASPARTALTNIRNIFLFCGICGYVFIPVKMFWPAWRLYDLFMAFLAYYTWRYALGANTLRVVYSELSESKKLRADLLRTQEESRQKTAFLNALSHDLRTPLNGLQLQAQVARLSMQSNDEAATREALTQIEQDARSTGDLLENILQCAKLDWATEPLQVTTFTLEAALRSASAAARLAASGKGVAFSTIDCADIELRTDRFKLERIVQNLTSNAAKFTEKGSIRIVAECNASDLLLHVIDTGIGLNVDQQERAFDEFYQGNNDERDRSKGFGLGLPIARRLAAQLGGSISIASSVGHGSRFTLQLPDVVLPRSASPAFNAVPATA